MMRRNRLIMTLAGDEEESSDSEDSEDSDSEE